MRLDNLLQTLFMCKLQVKLLSIRSPKIFLFSHNRNTLLYSGTGNLPQDSAPVCINIDISPEMAAQSAQRNQAFCVTASDWSLITSA